MKPKEPTSEDLIKKARAIAKKMEPSGWTDILRPLAQRLEEAREAMKWVVGEMERGVCCPSVDGCASRRRLRQELSK